MPAILLFPMALKKSLQPGPAQSHGGSAPARCAGRCLVVLAGLLRTRPFKWGVPPPPRQGQALRAEPRRVPRLPRRLWRLVQARRYPSARAGLDGFPPLIGAGLDGLHDATLHTKGKEKAKQISRQQLDLFS